MDLSDAEIEAIQQIRGAREAWYPRSLLSPDVVATLMDRGLLQLWTEHPQGVMVCFTAIGAHALDLDIKERYRFGSYRPRPNRPLVRAAAQVPRWTAKASLAEKVTDRTKLKKPKYISDFGLPMIEDPPPIETKANVAEQARDEDGEPLALRFGMVQATIPVMVDHRMAKGKQRANGKKK